MLSQRTKQAAYLLAIADALSLSAAFVFAFVSRSAIEIPVLGSPDKPVLASHTWLLFLAVPLFWILAGQAGLYRSSVSASYLRLLRSCSVCFFFLGLVLGTSIFVFQAKTYSRAVFFLFLVFASSLVVLERLALKAVVVRMRRRDRSHRNVLIIGTSPEALALGARVSFDPDAGIRLIGHLAGPEESRLGPDGVAILGGIEDLKRIVEEEVVDEVVFAVPFPKLLESEKYMALCEEVGVPVHLKVDFVRTLFSRTSPSEWDGIPMLTISPIPQDAVALLLKRSVDVVVSASTLVLLSPLLLLCALAVRLSSSGPILFSQPRVGLNGRTFRLYKFRSMYADAENRKAHLRHLNEMSGPVFKMKSDPRVTWIGHRLRRLSLDELPQLWNVMRGDMSLVGPRPPIPEEVQGYARWQRRRLSMKPGLTCLWQVNGRNRVGFEEWMKLDLAYIDNWSLKLDLWILLRTIPAVLQARGAQ